MSGEPTEDAPRPNDPRVSSAGAETLERMRAFISDVALPRAAAFEQEHPHSAFALEPDGRLAEPVYALKTEMQQLSANAGLYCPHLPAPDGLGLGFIDCMHLHEEVFRHGLRGQQWALAWTEGPNPLVRHWSPEARERVLPDFLGGREAVCFALTEPGVGSDFPALQTTARADGSGWRLSGEKHLITGAPQAGFAQVFGRIEGAARSELTCFLVPLDAAGVERGPVQQTIMADGQTSGFTLHDVYVDKDSLIGRKGEAQALAFEYINWARTRRGGMAAGLGRHCVNAAVDYAHDRKAYGRPIAELGAVSALLADMVIDLEALRALSLELLGRLDARGTALSAAVSAADRRDISILKSYCDDALYRIADRAIQVHGGRGVLTTTGLEKIFRVARNLKIPAGTAEVQRAIIARSLQSTRSDRP